MPYQPETDLDKSKLNLQGIVDTQVEVADQTLFESTLDILASRAGDRWKVLDELWLSTRSGISVVVGYREADEDTWEHVFIGTEETNQAKHLYWVEKENEDVYGTIKVLEEENVDVSGYVGTNLSAARLLQILADAHNHTPLEELTDDDFSSKPDH